MQIDILVPNYYHFLKTKQILGFNYFTKQFKIKKGIFKILFIYVKF